jgi:hypothetical protein
MLLPLLGVLSVVGAGWGARVGAAEAGLGDIRMRDFVPLFVLLLPVGALLAPVPVVLFVRERM